MAKKTTTKKTTEQLFDEAFPALGAPVRVSSQAAQALDFHVVKTASKAQLDTDVRTIVGFDAQASNAQRRAGELLIKWAGLPQFPKSTVDTTELLGGLEFTIVGAKHRVDLKDLLPLLQAAGSTIQDTSTLTNYRKIAVAARLAGLSDDEHIGRPRANAILREHGLLGETSTDTDDDGSDDAGTDSDSREKSEAELRADALALLERLQNAKVTKGKGCKARRNAYKAIAAELARVGVSVG